MDLSSLNPAQREAVTAPGGYHLVVAGAGTGKTRTLVHRVAWLVEQGEDPAGIVLLTFTRRAAQEMLARAGRLVGRGALSVRGGTFHAFAHAALRRHGAAVGLPPDFTLLDRSDALELMGQVRAELRPRRARGFPRRETLLHLVGLSAGSLRPLEEVTEEHLPWQVEHLPHIERIAAAYAARKREQALVDYDDLLTLLSELLAKRPEARAALAGSVRHLLVDELQDTNRCQVRIAALLSVAHKNLMVVGDDAQAIYRFRGACPDNLLDFPRLFPESRVTVLETNYRSTGPVLELATAVLRTLDRGFDRRLVPDGKRPGPRPLLVRVADAASEAEWVARRVVELQETGVELDEQAVLFRASHHANELELVLRREGIPYRKYGGLRFVESAHVKDVVALLRLVVNPLDRLAWTRVLRWFDGIGPATAGRIADRAAEADPPGLDPAPWAARRYGEDLARLAALLAEIGERRAHPSEAVHRALEGYRPVARARFDDHPRRLRDLDTLERLAERHPTLEGLLADLALDPPVRAEEGQEQDDGPVLTLSTIHSAKGLEWTAVTVLGLRDGSFPGRKALGDPEAMAEERRLLYVAVTRARRDLALVAPGVVAWGPARGLAAGCSLLDEAAIAGLVDERNGELDLDGAAAIPEEAPADDPELVARLLGFFEP